MVLINLTNLNQPLWPRGKSGSFAIFKDSNPALTQVRIPLKVKFTNCYISLNKKENVLVYTTPATDKKLRRFKLRHSNEVQHKDGHSETVVNFAQNQLSDWTTLLLLRISDALRQEKSPHTKQEMWGHPHMNREGGQKRKKIDKFRLVGPSPMLE